MEKGIQGHRENCSAVLRFEAKYIPRKNLYALILGQMRGVAALNCLQVILNDFRFFKGFNNTRSKEKERKLFFASLKSGRDYAPTPVICVTIGAQLRLSSALTSRFFFYVASSPCDGNCLGALKDGEVEKNNVTVQKVDISSGSFQTERYAPCHSRLNSGRRFGT